MSDWHSRMQRSQQLAKSLARSGRQAVYVNPHLGLEYPRPYAFDPHTRISKLEPRLFELHVHLLREHGLETRLLTARESSWIASELGRLVDSGEVREAALIISFPAWFHAACELRRRYGFPIVYDCHDWLPGFGRISPALIELEDDMFARADLVLFSSQVLQDRVLARHSIGQKSALLRNAVDPIDSALPALSKDATRPPTIGYVGALDHWFDVDSVAAVARDHPDWPVVLAGRVEDHRILQLRALPNVLFAGEIPHSALNSVLQTWDAAMIPFLVNELTLATNPIKLYEHFGIGLPVISTPLPEVKLYRSLVYLADSPAAFSSMSAIAMRVNDPSLTKARIEAARRETWAARAERLSESVGALMCR
jgi:glycosyltransferase involved in cell wall biosynthesis